MTSTAAAVHNAPWVHRGFRKDKLRVRERYWRPFQGRSGQQEGNIVVLPNGIVWRKYLPFIQHLVNKEKNPLQWILLESAVELMDWRNSSPSVPGHDGKTVLESAAMQERNRIKTLVSQNPDTVIPFCDLSVREADHDEMNLLHYSEMSISERSRHALMRACRMLSADAPSDNRILVIVDANEEGLNFYAEDGVQILGVNQFVEFLFKEDLLLDDEQQALMDLISQCEHEYQRRNHSSDQSEEDATTGSTPYLSDALVQKGLGNNTLLRGRLEVTKENPREGYVTVNGQRLFINQNLGHFNRALHDDVVLVQPLPELQWGRPVGRRRLVHHRPDESSDVPIALNEVSGEPSIPSARVVAIYAPSRRRYVATLVDQPTADESAFLVIPMNTRIPKIRLRSRAWQKYSNKRLLVEVDEWDGSSNYPGGHCVKIVGDVGDLETEISCLLLEHDIQLEPFSIKALACLPPSASDWTIPPEEVPLRRDLRHSHRIFSVDPPGCQDIDDTMHARTLSNGDVEVGVHIADVTHFVPHNSALDKEAQVRGTTFYLVDRRFDMLPSVLSSDLCSLHGNRDRLAVSVIWTMTPDLETVKSCWYGRTIIHNMQAMTYEQAHNILLDKAPDHPKQPPPPPLTAGAPVDPKNVGALKQDLSVLTRLARKLRKDREDIGGAVDLSSGDLGSELKFVLDENGHPTKVAAKKEMEIHHTIAEMMILANQYVAKKIYNHFPESSLLRIHQTVQEDRFTDLESALKAGGVAFEGTSNMELARSLNNARRQAGSGSKEVNALWQSLATRAVSEAKYVCTGGEVGSSLSHYGLGIEHYTHFTSPIRRYADVVVHKQLLASLENERHLPISPSDETIPSSRTYLDAVPDSNVISILGGVDAKQNTEMERRNENETFPEELEGDDLLDSLIDGASELALGGSPNADAGEESSKDLLGQSTIQSKQIPYTASEVSSICDGLNQQNRTAKLSSFDCQRLFLSLFFRDNVVETQAVVTDLRVNGLLVYVPMFDMKGPVFLTDINGNVQIDPALLGLPRDAGLPATLGFTAVKSCRMFPTGTCEMEESGEGKKRLQVRIPDTNRNCVFRTLDVVSVQLSSDFSDTRARIPPPRLHLLSVRNHIQPKRVVSEIGNVKSDMIQRHPKAENREAPAITKNAQLQEYEGRSPGAISEILASIEIRPLLPGVPMRFQEHRSKSQGDLPVNIVGGRIVVGGFSNPDTRAAVQEAAVTASAEAAAQRRAIAASGNQVDDEYRSTQNQVTSRMQRLAAQKRNARISKSK